MGPSHGADDGRPEREKLKVSNVHIIAANKKHFESLVNDFKKYFRALTVSERFIEFEDVNTHEIIFIEFKEV